jgi:hypothetical protein
MRLFIDDVEWTWASKIESKVRLSIFDEGLCSSFVSGRIEGTPAWCFNERGSVVDVATY